MLILLYMKLVFNLAWVAVLVGVGVYVFMIRTTRVELKKCDDNFSSSLQFSRKDCQTVRDLYRAYLACEKEAGLIPYSVKMTREVWGRVDPQYADKYWGNEVSKYCR